ncbi:MAG: FAD-dependent oxidoreductase [Chloroflexota bacterium]
MTTGDVIVVGAGVQGVSLAFHLAERGASVIVCERQSVGAGATGRSSGFVRMHYDLEAEVRLAWASLPYFWDWTERVGAGDPGFVRTGFLQLVPRGLSDHLRANTAMQQQLGVPTLLLGTDDVERLVPDLILEDVEVAAYEPLSGYADPAATAAGFLAAARNLGTRYVGGCRVERVTTDGERVTGVATDRGTFAAPTVVDAAGAWAGALAATVGVEVPIETWRHDTFILGRPAGLRSPLPIVLDHALGIYLRPEGAHQLLVGLEDENHLGGDPDRPLEATPATTTEIAIERLTRRLPIAESATLERTFAGQDGMTPDQRAIIGPAGPDGFWLCCGFSGTGFKTAPAVGAALAAWICGAEPDGGVLAPFRLERFRTGALLVGDHPYPSLWR